jgi:hypothetical protein
MSVESGARRGAVLGAALGAAGGVLLATGSGFLAAGPLLAALEAAVGGGAFGTIQGGFLGLLFARTKIDFGEDDLRAGHVLLGVNADTRGQLAADILEKCNGSRIEVHDQPLEADSSLTAPVERNQA